MVMLQNNEPIKLPMTMQKFPKYENLKFQNDSYQYRITITVIEGRTTKVMRPQW
jgi:hypothetical protein